MHTHRIGDRQVRRGHSSNTHRLRNARHASAPDGSGQARLEHSRHPAGLKDKLARYDALITGWARTQEPFLSAGLPPAVIFVFPDEPMALAVAKLADALVRGRIASLEDRQGAWPYPGASGCSSAPSATCTRGRCGRSCCRAPGGGAAEAAGLKGKPMPVGLVRRDIIRGTC